ncbi:UDP-N-acetylmuramoyl-tripeptide--D-alanyl-D-alanine ligase [Selenomonas ruminantium subsp. lactilytica TAM6421]|uniref:UDP-N-acetylmuramoyl-tripeptide--D-alanyl-D-alanine ligase n=1 Tax=Selenomonas ruminantium subsp. lactilytica (strain NBRC 103574 / TAM6421) TaxID=927704 RepID=I0GMY7_SELRL|nr:UDP-N-acetylmuramoyl-tripeptide--D-alanyl-D-alanine ligase [Selenomonas ruminantium]BAL82124.1 UDP-N-acetylmuramoyl-tripeptide--D-alanyl-D-alanine ligase [Selenomonas ruminantium subsp. lactilytica TAM6421]
MFTLDEIVKAISAKIYKEEKKDFSAVVTDTRKISAGVLFVALKGERFNGEDFAAEALEKGAAGVVVSENCAQEQLDKCQGTVLQVADTLTAYQLIAKAWRDKFPQIPVVAITGSNGKTTTKDLTAAVLSAKGDVLKTQANFNNEIGLPLTLLGLKAEHKAAVVEIGMRGFHQIDALAPIASPQIGIVTNVGETHMELLGSLENIAKAKQELVEAIPAGGTVILNADNKYVAGMGSAAKEGVKVMTFGIEKDADVKGEALHTEGNVTKFMVTYANERHEYEVNMVGRHNVYNTLAAIAAGFAMGLTPDEVRRGLGNLEATKMRFELQQVKEWNVVNDAYNASPMSMTAAINTLSELAKGRKIAVLGDMLELGSVSEEAHIHVGEEVAEHGFTALVTRGEMGNFIAKGAEAKGMTAVYRCASHEEAADKLHELLQPGDTLLFKGSRGMAMEKIIDLL